MQVFWPDFPMRLFASIPEEPTQTVGQLQFMVERAEKRREDKKERNLRLAANNAFMHYEPNHRFPEYSGKRGERRRS